MKERLIVIGGVAAGPKAASKAKRCNPDMEVVIYQEEGAVSYGGCGLPYYVGGRIKERKHLLARTAEQFALDGIQVKMRHRVDEIIIKGKTISGTNLDTGEKFTDRYDWVVLATGSFPIRPRLEDLTLQNIFYLRSIFDADLLLQKVQPGAVRHVAVVGGGYIGLEMAEALTEIGKQVTVVELASQILTPFDEDMAAGNIWKKRGSGFSPPRV